MPKPIQYQKGWVEFYKLKFKVTKDVLIPRPETELLVDELLHFLGQTTNYKLSTTILDVGTGSGNISIALAKQLPTLGGSVQIIATDISQKALGIAKLNAKFQRVEDKIIFLQSDLLSSLERRATRSNLIIVTNLPYIPSERIPYLDPSVKDYEPHIALDGGKDGFELYRKLFNQLTKIYLTHRAWKAKYLIAEIDYTHGELAKYEALKFFPRAKVEVKTDLSHKQRILVIEF